MEFLKDYRTEILTVLLIINAIGFCVGVFISAEQRSGGNCRFNLQRPGCEDAVKSGCVYRSLSAFSNPGYILGCELFRKRFEKEGF